MLGREPDSRGFSAAVAWDEARAPNKKLLKAIIPSARRAGVRSPIVCTPPRSKTRLRPAGRWGTIRVGPCALARVIRPFAACVDARTGKGPSCSLISGRGPVKPVCNARQREPRGPWVSAVVGAPGSGPCRAIIAHATTNRVVFPSPIRYSGRWRRLFISPPAGLGMRGCERNPGLREGLGASRRIGEDVSDLFTVPQ